MAKLSTHERDHLPDSAFAVPGKRALPIHDRSHAEDAWREVDRTEGLSDEERAEARRRIKAALHRDDVSTAGYSKSMSALDGAHEELEKHMAQEEKSRLSKSLSALRSRFGLSSDEALAKGKSVAETTPMPGDEGYPNNQGAAKRIAAARNKSTPAKDPENHYEGLPDAEDDTTDYENSEPDEMDGHGGKKVTAKSFAATSEDDIYKSMVEADPTGDVVANIDATDALELLASVMGKSIAFTSRQIEAVGGETQELHKSLASLASAVVEIGAAVEALQKSQADGKSNEEPAEDEERKTGEESEEEVEKSLSAEERKYKRTMEFLDRMDKMNQPAFFSGLTGEGLNKSYAPNTNTPESLNTPAGKQRVKAIVTSLVKSGKIDADYLSALSFKSPYEVVAALPSDVRHEAGLA